MLDLVQLDLVQHSLVLDLVQHSYVCEILILVLLCNAQVGSISLGPHAKRPCLRSSPAVNER